MIKKQIIKIREKMGPEKKNVEKDAKYRKRE